MSIQNTIILDDKSVMMEEIKSTLAENFSKCITGYHKLNDAPVKESFWEEINAVILEASGCKVSSISNGSHSSGKDLSTALGNFSNKSGIVSKKNNFDISSYRLTTVCSREDPGNIAAILAEINKRKNFDYYSLLIRKDVPNTHAIHYIWYLLPADYCAVNPNSYTWSHNNKKWYTNSINGSSMSITFSMSSQLWMKLTINDEFKEFVVGECTVPVGRTMNYIQLENMYASAISPNLPETCSVPVLPVHPFLPIITDNTDAKSTCSIQGTLTISDIKAELKRLGIKGYSNKKREQLLEMLPEGHSMRSLCSPSVLSAQPAQPTLSE